MSTAAETAPAIDIDAYLAEQDAKDQLRFITCGSVDDGKSTLIGRLLYDSKMIFEAVLRGLCAMINLFYQTNQSFFPCTSVVETSYSNRYVRKQTDYRVVQVHTDVPFLDAYF